MKLIIRFCIILVIVFLLSFSFLRKDIFLSSFLDFSNNLSVISGLVLKEVWVKGRRNLKEEEIINSLNIEIGDPILFLDLNKISYNLSNLKWVKNNKVFLNSLGKLEIEIEEYIPVATYETSKGNYLIDDHGNIIKSVNSNIFESLIKISGQNALNNMQEIKEIVIETNNFFYSLKKIEHIGGRRWNTYFKEGFFAKLPEKDYKIALRKLASMLSQYDIKTERLVFIDLRLLDRVSLKYKD